MFARVSVYWFLALADLTRSIATTISIPFVRQRPVHVAAFQHFAHEVAAFFHLAVEARQTSRALLQHAPPHIQKQQTAVQGNTVADYLDTVPLAAAMTAIVLHRKFHEWRRRYEALQEVPAEATSQEQVADVDGRIDELMVDVLICLHEAIQERKDSAVELFSHQSMFTFPKFHFKWFCLVALRIKCAEDGGQQSCPAAGTVHADQSANQVRFGIHFMSSWRWLRRRSSPVLR